MFVSNNPGNKLLKKREEEKMMEAHLQRIQNARPNTTGWAPRDVPRLLNNGKKNMLIEDKFTEIERENRLLLEKITNTMNKRAQSVTEREPTRTLHSGFRKRQLENIQIQNARLLKRLQQKRSDYQADKMHQDWKRQKAVIKNIANFPLVIKDGTRKQRKRALSRQLNSNTNALSGDIQLMRLRKIDGVNMIVTIKLDQQLLTILGDLKKQKIMKVIQIPREEAMEFIEVQCDGKIQNIFDRLRYDQNQGVLYLLSQDAEYEQQIKPSQKPKE